MNDIILGFRYQIRDEIEEDVSCKSQYMLEVMPKVGQMMREDYHWIPKETKMLVAIGFVDSQYTWQWITRLVMAQIDA